MLCPASRAYTHPSKVVVLLSDGGQSKIKIFYTQSRKQKVENYRSVGHDVLGFTFSAQTQEPTRTLIRWWYSSVVVGRAKSRYFTPKGTADHAELCANTDANHTCIQFSQLFFLQKYFMLMLTKEYIFGLENFKLLHNFKKLRQPLIFPVIYLYFTYMITCWAKPYDPGLFD